MATTSSRPPSRAWPGPCATPYGWRAAASRPPKRSCDRNEPVIAVLDYGIGNLRSAEKALQHLGVDAALTTDPAVARQAAGVVLPGVGAFGRCMEQLRESGLEPVVHEAVEAGKPFLGICVGMQMLFDSSEEAPGCKGLGIIPGEVRRLPVTTERLPHMGWNTVKIRTGSVLFDGIDDGS